MTLFDVSAMSGGGTRDTLAPLPGETQVPQATYLRSHASSGLGSTVDTTPSPHPIGSGDRMYQLEKTQLFQGDEKQGGGAVVGEI